MRSERLDRKRAPVDPDAAMPANGPPDEATATPAEMARWGRLVGQKLNAIEGNPLTSEDVAHPGAG